MELPVLFLFIGGYEPASPTEHSTERDDNFPTYPLREPAVLVRAMRVKQIAHQTQQSILHNGPIAPARELTIQHRGRDCGCGVFSLLALHSVKNIFDTSSCLCLHVGRVIKDPTPLGTQHSIAQLQANLSVSAFLALLANICSAGINHLGL